MIDTDREQKNSCPVSALIQSKQVPQPRRTFYFQAIRFELVQR